MLRILYRNHRRSRLRTNAFRRNGRASHASRDQAEQAPSQHFSTLATSLYAEGRNARPAPPIWSAHPQVRKDSRPKQFPTYFNAAIYLEDDNKHISLHGGENKETIQQTATSGDDWGALSFANAPLRRSPQAIRRTVKTTKIIEGSAALSVRAPKAVLCFNECKVHVSILISAPVSTSHGCSSLATELVDISTLACHGRQR